MINSGILRLAILFLMTGDPLTVSNSAGATLISDEVSGGSYSGWSSLSGGFVWGAAGGLNPVEGGWQFSSLNWAGGDKGAWKLFGDEVFATETLRTTYYMGERTDGNGFPSSQYLHTGLFADVNSDGGWSLDEMISPDTSIRPAPDNSWEKWIDTYEIGPSTTTTGGDCVLGHTIGFCLYADGGGVDRSMAFDSLQIAGLAQAIPSNVLTLGFPGSIESIDYGAGNLTFGVESLQSPTGAVSGLNFTIKGISPQPDGETVVFGMTTIQGTNQVWRASTQDGQNFTDAMRLYMIPEAQTEWLKGKMTCRGDQLLLMNCEKGYGGITGHYMHMFGGSLDGSGWQKLQSDPVFYGQDAFSLAWNEEINEFVAYPTSYQAWPDKPYPDNMVATRRVLHVRTSPDGVTWMPSNSFGVGGPYLPLDQLILPDEKDPPETEFYNFSVIDLGEFWMGAMMKYISQPSNIPNAPGVSHGPFMECEWWVSENGLEWTRPFGDDSSLDGIPYNFSNHLHQPMVVGEELCWVVPVSSVKTRYSLNRRRICYAYSRSNTELTTKSFCLSGEPITMEVRFESVARGDESLLLQGYLMAELLDDQGQVITGFNKEKCVFDEPSADTQLTLTWDGDYLPDNYIGQKVSLHLFFRDVRLYSISH
jgi:hypothetical protein